MWQKFIFFLQTSIFQVPKDISVASWGYLKHVLFNYPNKKKHCTDTDNTNICAVKFIGYSLCFKHHILIYVLVCNLTKINQATGQTIKGRVN